MLLLLKSPVTGWQNIQKLLMHLINAVRNGKQVTVMLELRARFDEEANLEWKERLEEEGVKVLIGIPNMKVHAKICLIRKRLNDSIIHYGFVSTGNLNEKTAKFMPIIACLPPTGTSWRM